LSVEQTGNFASMSIVCKNTSSVGYATRRLVKALEDVSIRYDNTVRNSKNTIVQFLYGEDGLDATYLENVVIHALKCNRDDLYKYYYTSEQEFEPLLKLWKITAQLKDDAYFPMPVNIQRILTSSRLLITDSTKVEEQKVVK